MVHMLFRYMGLGKSSLRILPVLPIMNLPTKPRNCHTSGGPAEDNGGYWVWDVCEADKCSSAANVSVLEEAHLVTHC